MKLVQSGSLAVSLERIPVFLSSPLYIARNVTCVYAPCSSKRKLDDWVCCEFCEHWHHARCMYVNIKELGDSALSLSALVVGTHSISFVSNFVFIVLFPRLN